MRQKILVIDSDQATSDLIKNSLREEGYEVITAAAGSEALKKARHERPDVILLATTLPDMDSESVARHLKVHPDTSHLPIIFLITEDELEDMVIGADSVATDYVLKPIDDAELKGTIKAILGEEEEEKKTVISSGSGELDNKMGGGVPLGSLTLIEGSSGAGKSVLSQQMIWGSLQDRFRLSVFTTENTIQSLVRQMRSLNLEIIDFLLLGRIRVYPVEVAQLGAQAPAALLQAMRRERGRDIIFLDSLTAAMAHSPIEAVLGFFEQAKRLCSDGMTIVVILHSHAVNSELLIRIRSLCDAHLQLRSEEVGKKLVKTLEVTKVKGADKTTGNIISFEVEPGWGMRIIPVNKVKG